MEGVADTDAAAAAAAASAAASATAAGTYAVREAYEAGAYTRSHFSST
jgi:hypothetical protein